MEILVNERPVLIVFFLIQCCPWQVNASNEDDLGTRCPSLNEFPPCLNSATNEESAEANYILNLNHRNYLIGNARPKNICRAREYGPVLQRQSLVRQIFLFASFSFVLATGLYLWHQQIKSLENPVRLIDNTMLLTLYVLLIAFLKRQRVSTPRGFTVLTLIGLPVCTSIWVESLYFNIFDLGRGDKVAAPTLVRFVPALKRGALIGRIGLTNLTNTCYMNSCIQVILHLKKVRLLLDSYFVTFEELASSRMEPALEDGRALIYELAHLEYEMWSPFTQVTSLVPKSFKVTDFTYLFYSSYRVGCPWRTGQQV